MILNQFYKIDLKYLPSIHIKMSFNNTHMEISQAIDELLNDPPIPSASAIIDNIEQYPDILNPMSLTVDIPNLQPDLTEDNFPSTPPNQGEVVSDFDSTISSLVSMDEDTEEETEEVTIERSDERSDLRTLVEAVGALNERDCAICFNKFDIDSIVNTVCNHTFCKACFFRWMRGNVTCPYCRNNITSWSRHSKDDIDTDIRAVTEMFNSTLREHIHLNKLNKKITKEVSSLHGDKQILMDSLVSTRNLVEYNRGYGKGLLSTFRPKCVGNEDFDRGLMRGYDEFKETIKKDRKKKRKAATRTMSTNIHAHKKTHFNSEMFVFHGTD